MSCSILCVFLYFVTLHPKSNEYNEQCNVAAVSRCSRYFNFSLHFEKEKFPMIMFCSVFAYFHVHY